MKTLVLIVLLLACIIPLNVFALSYPPHIYHVRDRQDIFIKGDPAYLFHSGTEEIKKSIYLGDILAVYRINPSCEVTEVGRIKILSFAGDIYLKGEVIEGEIRPDDIARKGNVSFLVISAGICNHNK